MPEFALHVVDADLENRFSHHAPDADKILAHEGVREEVLMVAEHFAETLPESREKSLAITKLEEAMFWANAALARMDAEGNRL